MSEEKPFDHFQAIIDIEKGITLEDRELDQDLKDSLTGKITALTKVTNHIDSPQIDKIQKFYQDNHDEKNGYIWAQLALIARRHSKLLDEKILRSIVPKLKEFMESNKNYWVQIVYGVIMIEDSESTGLDQYIEKNDTKALNYLEDADKRYKTESSFNTSYVCIIKQKKESMVDKIINNILKECSLAPRLFANYLKNSKLTPDRYLGYCIIGASKKDVKSIEMLMNNIDRSKYSGDENLSLDTKYMILLSKINREKYQQQLAIFHKNHNSIVENRILTEATYLEKITEIYSMDIDHQVKIDIIALIFGNLLSRKEDEIYSIIRKLLNMAFIIVKNMLEDKNKSKKKWYDYTYFYMDYMSRNQSKQKMELSNKAKQERDILELDTKNKDLEKQLVKRSDALVEKNKEIDELKKLINKQSDLLVEKNKQLEEMKKEMAKQLESTTEANKRIEELETELKELRTEWKKKIEELENEQNRSKELEQTKTEFGNRITELEKDQEKLRSESENRIVELEKELSHSRAESTIRIDEFESKLEQSTTESKKRIAELQNELEQSTLESQKKITYLEKELEESRKTIANLESQLQQSIIIGDI